MFHFITRNAPKFRSLSSQHYHTTRPIRMSGVSVPEDWQIVETSPGGVDKDFCNMKTGEETWYTPEGMTAEEILRVPGATKYWNNAADVQKYIEAMAKQKEENGGKDIKDS